MHGHTHGTHRARWVLENVRIHTYTKLVHSRFARSIGPYRWAAREHFTAYFDRRLLKAWSNMGQPLHLCFHCDVSAAWKARTARLRTSDRRTRLLRRGAKEGSDTFPKSFTVLFTAHDTGQPAGSGAGCGPFATCSNSPVLLRRWRAPGEGLERREFSPGIPEVTGISKTLKDRLP